MINAEEARNLMELDTTVQRQLDLIDTMIRSAAQNGSHQIVYYVNNFDVGQRIFSVLQDNGFRVEELSTTRLGITW
jgi:hypothetical protein